MPPTTSAVRGEADGAGRWLVQPLVANNGHGATTNDRSKWGTICDAKARNGYYKVWKQAIDAALARASKRWSADVHDLSISDKRES